jgi:UV DNA damage endonuclease
MKIRNRSKSKSKANESDEEKSDVALLITPSKYACIGPARIRLGLCCINNYLRENKPSIFCGRSMILATYKSKGSKEAIDRGLKNVQDIIKILEWNKLHHIECLRLSSDLFPHYTNLRHIDEEDRYELSFAKDDLKKAGDYAKMNGMRITMHPGQFNVIATNNDTVFESTVADLKMHADILDMMGMGYDSVIVIHGGGTYGDKEETIKRWILNFKKLPDNVQRRLVLENCEKNFSIVDCLKVHKELEIPIVFDNHHFECYKKYHPDEEFEDIETYLLPTIETWLRKGIRPKFHISEQAPDKNVGAHSDYIETFPEYYLNIPKKYQVGVDIMIEAKAKEAAILSLYSKYQEHFLSHVDPDEIPDDFFKINVDKLRAEKCSRCKS